MSTQGESKTEALAKSSEGRENLNNDVQKSAFVEALKKARDIGWEAVKLPFTIVDLPAKGMGKLVELGSGSETAGNVAKWITRGAMIAAALGFAAWWLWPKVVAILGPGIAEVARRVSNALSDSATAEVAATGTGVGSTNSLGEYSSNIIEVEPTPLSGGSMLRQAPISSSPGDPTGGIAPTGGRIVR